MENSILKVSPRCQAIRTQGGCQDTLTLTLTLVTVYATLYTMLHATMTATNTSRRNPLDGYIKYAAAQLMRRRPEGLSFEDLIQSGHEGLLRAERDWRGLGSWPMYARVRIRGEMLNEIQRNRWASKTLFNDVLRKHPARMLDYQRSLNTVQLSDYINTVPATDKTTDPEYTALLAELIAAVNSLPKREAYVLTAWLLDYPGAVTANALGVTETRVSQLKAEALARVRKWAGREQEGWKRERGRESVKREHEIEIEKTDRW
ncbi:MAG: sigma-70 family RNA polymerase sigma factor [Nitrososphaera sp.]